jgi:surface antigen-like variable number repeat protein
LICYGTNYVGEGKGNVMIKKFGGAFCAMLITCVFGISARTQSKSSDGGCPGPVYESKDVARRARILQYPNTSVLSEVAAQYGFHGTIKADAVLCRSGYVTDVRLTPKLPENLDTFVKFTVGSTRFTPAELDFHSVSQRIKFELSINEVGNHEDEIDPANAEGRLIERVEIIGNRRLDHSQIFGWIKTRPGDSYHQNQINRDLRAILTTNYFDKRQTTMRLEQGAQGGVAVILEVVEVPTINRITFQGLPIDSSTVLAKLDTQLKMRTGAPFQADDVQPAISIIKQLLESNGKRLTNVYVNTERLDAMTINITFVITN